MKQKFCRDCKHYKSPESCYSPKNGYDLVTGEINRRIASFSRSENQIMSAGCGPEGNFFEAKIDSCTVPPVIKKKRWWAIRI